jgi:hypothetical protein
MGQVQGGMGPVQVGTASWTDRTLLESGWYPPEADTPERRLRWPFPEVGQQGHP